MIRFIHHFLRNVLNQECLNTRGTRSIIVCSENVTIKHTKYIAKDSFSANIELLR